MEKVAEEEMLLARLKAEVAHFKGEVLNLYKQHIESLSMIPARKKKRKAPEAPGLKNSPSLPGGSAEGRACGGGAPPQPGRTGQEASFESIRTLLLRTN